MTQQPNDPREDDAVERRGRRTGRALGWGAVIAIVLYLLWAS